MDKISKLKYPLAKFQVINQNSFKIGDTSKFNDYTREGICE